MSQVGVSVGVVVVTYGERWHLLEQVLKALQRQHEPVQGVVIVGNGVPYALHEQLEPLAREGFRIEFLHCGENRGSAAGYKVGMERALALGYDLIWLLDDDNVPRHNALSQLLRARRLLGDDSDYLFASLRLDREKYRDVVYRDAVLTVGLADTFMGFGITRLPHLLLERLRRPRQLAPSGHLQAPLKRIEYAVYGGLLLSRQWIERVGFPDERFVLYVDDREYTTRISRAGGSIFLVGTSVVEDVEQSWHIHAEQRKIPVLLDPIVSDDRIFYTVRNLVYYDLSYNVRWRMVYLVNIIVFIGLQTVVAMTRGVGSALISARLRLLFCAVSDGFRGRLGVMDRRIIDPIR